MHLAAYFGLDTLASALIDTNSSINVTDSFGRTPLLCAAQRGQELLVERLLTCHAKINICDTNGMSALRWAEWGGHQKVVSRLLDYKANIDDEELGEERPPARIIDDWSDPD